MWKSCHIYTQPNISTQEHSTTTSGINDGLSYSQIYLLSLNSDWIEQNVQIKLEKIS